MKSRSLSWLFDCHHSTARNIKKRLLVSWLAPKKGAIFSLIYFFKSFCIYYIPHNYVIPQAMPHAIPQTHSAFYPHRFPSVAKVLNLSISAKSSFPWQTNLTTAGNLLVNTLITNLPTMIRTPRKCRKQKKEAQRKIAESRAAKAAKARLWFKNPRSPGDTIANSSPSPSPFSLSAGNYSPRPVFLLAREVQEA